MQDHDINPSGGAVSGHRPSVADLSITMKGLRLPLGVSCNGTSQIVVMP